MSNYSTRRVFPGRIIFDHLPKTAGMSINSWLIDSLGDGCVIPNLIGMHSDLIVSYGGLYSIISGHIHFSAREGLDPRYQYITCIREPIDRVVSWLYFVSNNIDNSHPVNLVMEVDCFLNSNGQDLSDLVAKNISNLYVKHFGRVLGSGLESESEIYSNSMLAVKQYDVIGLVEMMPNFLTETAALIGLPRPLEIPRINITKQRVRVDQLAVELIENIKKINLLDIAFYTEVRALKAVDIQKNEIQKKILPVPIWNKYDHIPKQDLVTLDMVIINVSLKEGYSVNRGQLINFIVDIFLDREVNNLEMGICIMDSIGRVVFGTNNKLIDQLQEKMAAGSYCVTYSLFSDLPPGRYSAGFAFVEYNAEAACIELARIYISCEFEVVHQITKTYEGEIDLSANISIYPTTLVKIENVVSQFNGKLLSLKPIPSLMPGHRINLDVTIVNQSNQIWLGDVIHPIYLSYHWLTVSDELLIYEGIRTPLPESGISAGKSIDTEMIVEAPNQPGIYSLVLTLLQERIGWFEDNGFEASRLKVKVDCK